MAFEFRMPRRVQFAETDMAGILHFSNYFRYMEEVEHAFFRSLGFRVHGDTRTGTFGWARRAATCDYQRPLRYEDEVELHLLVRSKSSRAIVYETRFLLAGPDGPVEVARGTITAVCVAKSDDGGLRAVAMPSEVDAAIDVAPAEPLA